MATIDDFGDTAEPLNNPVLGGPAGWAAAVRDAINGKVAKTGDSMSGQLTMAGGLGFIFAPQSLSVAPLYDDAGYIAADPEARTQLGVFHGPSGALRPLNVADPTQGNHAVNKAYCDKPAGKAHGGPYTVTGGWQDVGVASVDYLAGGMTMHDGALWAPEAGLYLVTINLTWSWSGDGSVQSGCMPLILTAGQPVFPNCWQLSGSRRIIRAGVGSGSFADINTDWGSYPVATECSAEMSLFRVD